MNDELTALVFELQRAPSAVDKAKVLARAWRTVSGLKPAERRLLAREVGFDGAEELVDGLSGSERGVFAPTAVLEALGKLRADPDLSLRGILADLRDPDRRDDLLVRGMDLVTEGVAPAPEPDLGIERFEVPDGNVWMMEDDDSPDEVDEEKAPAVVAPPPPPEPKPQPQPRTEPQPEPRPEPEPEPEPALELPPEPEQPSPWDTMHEGKATLGQTTVVEAVSADRFSTEQIDAETSVSQRLRELREGIPDLGRASVKTLSERLDAFPEPWAKRRALAALIEADVPDDAAAALDLIEDLDRSMDRSWCLSVLARRGDLKGDDLDRALAMLSSPAARRLVATLV